MSATDPRPMTGPDAWSAPAPAYVGQLRARPGTLALGDVASPAPRWTIRVQSADVYDAVRLSAPPSEPVLAMKVAALRALQPNVEHHEDFVLKLHGAEVRDETSTIGETGATDGSIFILVHRRRRPVR